VQEEKRGLISNSRFLAANVCFSNLDEKIISYLDHTGLFHIGCFGQNPTKTRTSLKKYKRQLKIEIQS
jgi:hypothetical protein